MTSVKPFAPLARATYLKRAQFLDYQLWVTPSNAAERYASGDFPNQCPTTEGLPKWIEQDRSIVNTDVTVWHVFGVTHCPTPEQWPIMPVEHCGFKLTPFGFFDHSPSLDLPLSTANGHSQTTNGHDCHC
jgi:primary-amine oxidase